MTTYYDSAAGEVITRARAEHEVRVEHGHPAETWDRFLVEVGDRGSYDAQAVLDWLGY